MKVRNRGSAWLVAVSWGLVLALGWPARAADDGTAGQDVNWAEPNEAASFSAAWTSATLSASLQNPVEHRGMADTGVTRTLGVMAKITIDPLAKVFGTTHSVADLLAVTETGDQLAGPVRGSSYRSYSPLSLPGYQLTSLAFPMDPNRGYPVLLKEVSWTLYALLYRQEQWTDVPFQATAQWVQIAPGIKVQFTRATSQAGAFQYEFTGRYEGPASPFMGDPSVGEGSPLPWHLVAKIEMLDAKGATIRTSYSDRGQRQSAGSVVCSGSGEYSASGGVKTMRFRVILNPYEIKLPFVLTDIPVPTL